MKRIFMCLVVLLATPVMTTCGKVNNGPDIDAPGGGGDCTWDDSNWDQCDWS